MEEEKARKTVRTFAIASFLNDLGAEMIYSVWPLFVTGVLGASMSVLGFIDGLGEAIVSISQAASGYFSDRIKKRKPFVWIGYLFGAVSRIGYAFSTAWPQLVPLRIFDRAGKIRDAPRDAIVADVSVHKNRGKNFGFLEMMDNLGAVAGITVSILFFTLLGYRNLFLLAAVPSVIGALLIIFFVKDVKPKDDGIYKGFSLKSLDRNFRLFLMLSAVFALGSFSYSFLLIFAKEAGLEITLIPVLYLFFMVIASAFSMYFGNLADSIGRKNVLTLSFIFWGLVCLTFVLFSGPVAIVFAFLCYGLYKGAAMPVQKTFVSELAPTRYRASSLGAYKMAIGLCALPSSLIAGILWDQVNMYAPFYLSLGLTVLSLVLLFFVKEKKED